MQWKKIIFETLDSTNTVATDYEVGTVVVARHQTAGRGRYGRTWVSEEGNLFMSVVLKTYEIRSSLISFVMAVSVHRALKKNGVEAQIKWPNDILLNGAKIAGILLENIESKLIVGIGVNCVSCPKNLPYPTAHLNACVTSQQLMDDILLYLNEMLEIFENRGFEEIRRLWLQSAVGINQSIQVQLPSKILTGIFKDLGQSGALILQLPDMQLTEITAGTVLLN